MYVRHYVPGDYPGVFSLEKLCFDQHSAQQYLDLYMSSPKHFFIAMEDDRLVGYVAGWEDENLGRIISIGVDPVYRRMGIAMELMREFFGSLSPTVEWFVLEVRVSNIVAQRLYKKFGFISCQVISRYYLDGEDGLLMARSRNSLPG